MTTPIEVEQLDLLTHAPDGESRGLLVRVGDLFPLDPRPHLRSRIDEQASPVRPWGLGLLQVPQPQAGKHEGTRQWTTGGGDGQAPEDWGSD